MSFDNKQDEKLLNNLRRTQQINWYVFCVFSTNPLPIVYELNEVNEISGSHGGEYEDDNFSGVLGRVGYMAQQPRREPSS
jgi:hypothetical protein